MMVFVTRLTVTLQRSALAVPILKNRCRDFKEGTFDSHLLLTFPRIYLFLPNTAIKCDAVVWLVSGWSITT